MVQAGFAELFVDKTEWFIGRYLDCDVVIDDPHVSGRHCVVRKKGDKFTVSDTRSIYGTWIEHPDGTTIRAMGLTPISPGDTLIVGKSKIPWKQHTEPES